MFSYGYQNVQQTAITAELQRKIDAVTNATTNMEAAKARTPPNTAELESLENALKAAVKELELVK